MDYRKFLFAPSFALLFGVAYGQHLDYPISPVPFTKVKLDDRFWAPRLAKDKDVTIPIAFQKAEETGRIDNFRIAAGLMKGKFRTQYPFDDSDIYKNIEAASYALQITPDPHLEKYVDSLIDIIAAAQEPDGYLYTTRTIDPAHPHPWAGLHRWENEDKLSHELYNAGHLYEAATAYYQATGKRKLLDVALKNANLVDHDFGWGKIEKAPGHQVIEMGLVKLYRVTGDERYLKLAKFFIDMRGHNPELGEYAQNHEPFVKQDSAVGHAVRAEYMYSGAADVAAMMGLKEYIHALDTLWDDVVHRKMYVTGGTGATGGNEGFGPPYDLPNMSAYCETCASIADVFWNYRMFLLHGEAKYIDVLERILYNALLSGVSLSGDHFFYPNTLASMGQQSRSEWFGCACCPTNITRLLPSIPGYVYAEQGNRLYVNLFIQSTADVIVNAGHVQVSQKTDYPWSGKIEMTLAPEERQQFRLMIRIPGWAENRPIPGDLYRFEKAAPENISLRVNGEAQSLTIENGYAVIEREWKTGDEVVLDLPMPIRRVLANEKVRADQGRVALQRGPLVYCAEGVDNPGGRVLNIVLADDAALKAEYNSEMLDGIEVITGQAAGTYEQQAGGAVARPQKFLAIPYYAWANRGSSEMNIWFGRSAAYTLPLPLPTLASRSAISALHPKPSLTVVNNLYSPSRSNDPGMTDFDWWPRHDTTEWVEYDFAEPVSVSNSQVYWFDDRPDGDCRLPASWSIMYKSGDQWIPVKNTTEYEIAGDKLCSVSFVPVKTNSVRLQVVLPMEHSSGLYKWLIR